MMQHYVKYVGIVSICCKRINILITIELILHTWIIESTRKGRQEQSLREKQ